MEFTPQQQQYLNEMQTNIRHAMDELQTQIDELREQLKKEQDNG